MPKQGATYRWVDGMRISVEDGGRLLKTPEAAGVLGVPVEFVRELIREDKLPVKATYAIHGRHKGWLVSEHDLKLMAADPGVIEKQASYKLWRERQRTFKVKTVKPVPTAKVRPLKKRRSIVPDPFQVRSVELALTGADVLVVAPTGSGKTWIAEQLAHRAVQSGARFVYASPLKALSNQKYRDFCSLFGEDKAGIITGDVSVNPDGDVLTMTTEILRNKCLCSPCDLHGVQWIVLDEFHLLDSDRGAAWEQSVIFAPPDVSLVGLSATVSNFREVAAWMEWARGKAIEVVVSEHRPVPLVWRWFVDGKVRTEKTAYAKIASLREQKEEMYRSRRHGWYGGYRDYGYDDDHDEEEFW